MEFEEEPCRIEDEDTEELIGLCFPSFSLMTDEEHYDETDIEQYI